MQVETLKKYSLSELRNCAQRESAYRAKCYPKWYKSFCDNPQNSQEQKEKTKQHYDQQLEMMNCIELVLSKITTEMMNQIAKQMEFENQQTPSLF